MRVTGASQAAHIKAVRSPRRNSGGGGAFEVGRGPAPRRASALSGRPGLANSDTFLAVQMMDDPEQRKRKALDQGSEMLDLLDEIKIGLLGGHLDEQSLQKLKRVIEGRPLYSGDPLLEDVLKQIDLRARVELAKIAKSRA